MPFLGLPQCLLLIHGLSANWLLPVTSLHFRRWPFHLHIEFIQTRIRAKTTQFSSPSFRTWLLCFAIRLQLPGLAEQTVMVRAMSSEHLMLAAQASLPESSLAHFERANCTNSQGTLLRMTKCQSASQWKNNYIGADLISFLLFSFCGFHRYVIYMDLRPQRVGIWRI